MYVVAIMRRHGGRETMYSISEGIYEFTSVTPSYRSVYRKNMLDTVFIASTGVSKFFFCFLFLKLLTAVDLIV